MTGSLSTPGREVFPEYPGIPGMYEREVNGLSARQLDRTQPGKSWGAWPIRQQVSHVAWVHYRWYIGLVGKGLFGENLPRDKSLLDTGGGDRRLDPGRFHEMGDLLAALEDAIDLALEILGGETLGGMREKTFTRRIPGDQRWASGDGAREWTERVTLKAHPRGFWGDETDPDLFHYDLEYVFRHTLWECYAHLKTIQAHKKTMGLAPLADIPEVGYLKALEWE